MFFVRTGNTVTYLIGWSNLEGRKQKANYILLWEGIKYSKKLGVNWFDLGGLNKNTPEGIAHFKKGVGGSKYQMIGELWRFF